ncbi:MAG TPA: hypothetical protein VK151_00025 [Fluviicola sp.]|nr:hypothetical protein [Fluviicola sp.]
MLCTSIAQTDATSSQASSQGSVQKEKFIGFQSANLSLGGAHGIHPNQLNTFRDDYFFGEGNASLTIKGLPVALSFRLSEEPYRSGRPSYFRLSFEPYTYRRDQLQELKTVRTELDHQIGISADSIHKLESKWSYWNLKKQELEKIKKPELGLPQLPVIPSLPDTSFSVNPQLPDLPNGTIANADLSRMDSIQLKLQQVSHLLTEQQKIYSDLKLKQQELNAKYDQLISKTNPGFLNGIKKFDLGLSALSTGSLSRNAIPMQGIHVAGTIRKSFYDVAAGFTLPNQLFSNQVFDQLINNNSNLFNAGEFFAVNATRFVSSVIAGYGEREKNAISVESFYTGRSWQDIRKGNPGQQQLANNLVFYTTPKRQPNLTWFGSIGHSFSNDSTPVSSGRASALAYSSGINYQFPKLKSTLKALYRNLGSNYDGWAQGIYLQGAEHGELSYRQALTKRFTFQLRGAVDNYLSNDSTKALRKTQQGSAEIQLKLFKHTAFVGNYTLLNLTSDTLSQAEKLSHLGKAGLYHHRRYKAWKVSQLLDGGYARIANPDSSQRLLQLSGQLLTEWKKWGFGVKVSYTEFEGLTRLYGQNWCIQPEVSYTGPIFNLSLNYQYLKSEQFGTAGGCVFQSQFKISELFTLSYLFQRWLPTEYTFFLAEDQPDITKPIYMRWKLTLHLK